MAVYKLKNKKTGLYWIGGGEIPFYIPGVSGHWRLQTNENDAAKRWSKTGKSWSSKGAFNSAMTNMLKSSRQHLVLSGTIYYRIADYKVYDVVAKLLKDDCCIEIFEDPKIVDVFEIVKEAI